MSFMGATNDNSNLRLAGLACLQEVINRFSSVPEPEFPGHVILEQFQAQVGAALRPAFVAETPSHVTAAACQVCSTWIGSGVARDLNDLRRVHQLLVSSLGKLKHGSINTQLYSESAATLEKLAILKAWAEVYVVAVEQDDAIKEGKKDEDESHYGALYGRHESLLSLVIPELNSLVGYWLAALRDSALLSLPAEFTSQMPSEGGAFYTPESAESCKEYYRTSWPPILLATAMWLNKNNFEIAATNVSDTPKKWLSDKRDSRFHLMLGMCVETLSCSRGGYSDGDKTVQLCLRTLKSLIGCSWSQLELMKDVRVAIELMNVLHRLILTRDNLQTQLLCADVLLVVLDAATAAIKASKNEDVINENESGGYTGYGGEEGTLQDGFDAKTSLAFATLEVCLCLLVRQIPQINSALMKSKAMTPLHFRKYARLPMESYELIRVAIQALVRVPELCSVDGQLVVLPTVLYLMMGVLRESSRIDRDQLIPDAPPGTVSVAAGASMQALRALAVTVPDKKTGATEHWATIMRNEHKVDKAVIVIAVAVLVTALPPFVVLNSSIFHRICRLLKSCLESDIVQVRQKGLQAVVSLFAKKDICAPFIRELGPSVFSILKPHVLKGPQPASKEEPNAFDELTTDETATLIEAAKALEAISSAAKDKKAISMISLLVQSLTCFLCDDPANNYRSLGTCAKQLHDFAYQKLNAIGPTHPETFRKLVAAHPAIKARIEAAMLYAAARTNQVKQQQVAAAMQRKMSAEKHEPQAATIKLKNFALS
uniref:HEAT repeat-containing protein 5B n=1 Tax=Steinernema glaseri TaxID=37863 RepID=A0A1I7Z999_9BILA